jgi:hypothetical protein
MDRRRFVMRLIGPRLARRLIPRSLFGRSLLIIILPIALMQLAVVWAFFTAHQERDRRHRRALFRRARTPAPNRRDRPRHGRPLGGL